MDISTLNEAWAAVHRKWLLAKPGCGIVLGSGWGDIASLFNVKDAVAYADLPGLGAASVQGHAGRLLWCELNGIETFVFQGRRHFYEGAGWTPVAMPIFFLRKAGASTIVLTNAAGGIAEDLAPGSFLAISDHINMMGSHPLVGPYAHEWGERFPDQTRVYDAKMRRVFLDAAFRRGCAAREGVYLAVSGPVYETPAEVQAFKRLGADAVGMSTVPEASLANAAGLRVLGISCITNHAAGLAAGPLSHNEVRRVMDDAAGRIAPVLAEIWPEIGVKVF